jgi:hypothetical protein
VDSLFDWLISERGKEIVQGAGSSLFSEFSDTKTGTVLYRLTGIDVRQVSGMVGEWIVGMVSGRTGEIGKTGERGESGISGEGPPHAWNLIQTLAKDISHEGQRSIAEIVGLSDEDRERLEIEVSRLFLRVLNEQVPIILESVDVNTLVVEKIDSLDIEKVEELILTVIRDHLRWISLFGGLLGFLIGALQLVFFLLSV